MPLDARTKPDATRIRALDGVRAVSIILVCVGHAGHVEVARQPALKKILGILGNQSLGVRCFFVLSGFLITYLLLNESMRTGTISLRQFYVRRAFRILPAFYLYLAFVAVSAALGRLDVHALDLVSAALFVWNYVPSTGDWWVAHSWSLCVEEQFYLVWPLSLVLFGRKKALWLAVAIVVASPALRVATYSLLPAWRGRIPIMGHTRIDAMMFGALLALVIDHPIFLRVSAAIFRWRAPWVAAFVAFVASPLLGERFGGGYALPFGYSVDGLCIAILLAWLLRTPQSIVVRALSSRVATHLGVVSYSLYLWQQPFLTTLNKSWTGTPGISVLCALVAAEASYRFVERPCLSLRKRLLPEQRVTQRAPA